MTNYVKLTPLSGAVCVNVQLCKTGPCRTRHPKQAALSPGTTVNFVSGTPVKPRSAFLLYISMNVNEI